jgi:hypothetical protein
VTGVSIRLLAPDDDAAAIGEMTVAAYLTNEGDTDTGYHPELRRVARRARATGSSPRANGCGPSRCAF